MDNFSISGWAHAAIEALPESHHVTIKAMARYAIEYRICNRSVRNRRPSVTIARPLEVPCGYYQNAINGTPNEDDKFFAQVQFIYNLGWLSELDSGSLVLTIGTAYKPRRIVPASRERGGIPRRIRKLVFESDSDTC